MATINTHYQKLQAGYLFPEIGKRVRDFPAAHPSARIIRLGIGDVVLPLPAPIVDALKAGADEMARRETFRGYGPEQGYDFLLEAIADTFALKARMSRATKSSSRTARSAIPPTSKRSSPSTTSSR